MDWLGPELRRAAGLTPLEVSQRLKCTRHYIYQLETNKNIPSLPFLKKLMNLYGFQITFTYRE